MKTILIFGASGDTGKYLVDYLIAEAGNHDFKVIASGSRKTDYFSKLNIPYYQIDTTCKSDFDVLPKNIYGVVNLAGLMPARMQGYHPQRYIDVNITGNLNILDFCRENRIDRLLFAQSFGDIKDWGNEQTLLTADMPRRFRFDTDHSIYVMTKNFTVDLMRNYHEMYGIKTFVFRLPTIYLWSPIDTYYVDGEIRKIGYRILIDKAMAGEPIEIWGDPNRVKDMVYVKDFCQMIFKALLSDRLCGHYNVGTGIGTSLEEQVRGIIDVFSTNSKKSTISYRPDLPNAPKYIMDITPARNELGYEPKYNYLEMLKDLKREMELKRF